MGSPDEVLAHTQRFYRQHVYTSWVRDYLRSRHLSAAISEASIGYAPSGWTATTDHLLSLGHSPGDLVRAGVSINGDRRLRDVMRDRLILPVQDHTGRLVGFLGRANPKGTRSPKYLNTPATGLYEKRSTLYGLGTARGALAAGATPLIVEGPMDKLAVDKMASQFRGNIVALASCGTALTTDHLARIRTVTDKPVWFCFDADAAGQRALLHAWEITADQGRAAHRVVQLPANQDPASVHPTVLHRAIRDAIPMSVAVAQAQLERWGRPDNRVKAELMVDALAKRDADRIRPDDSMEWIGTITRLADVPISSVQAALIEHLAPTPTAADLDALRAASFPRPVTAETASQGTGRRAGRFAASPRAKRTSLSQALYR
ncbi:MAG: toprim domain-containing protein [Propionicimonas sp.]|nr:toprim domain-containing protein [Propionicimonas sp.]